MKNKLYFSTPREFRINNKIFGCLFTTSHKYGHQDAVLEEGCKFIVDNGIFNGKWTEETWKQNLSWYLPYKHNCYGVVIPDWLDKLPDGAVIGDWQKTIERFELYYHYVKELGFKIALATQDGLTPDKVPWDKIDMLFIGGSDNHKRGIEAQELAYAAIEKGIWVHIGRVSSVGNGMRKLWSWANSYDGTTYIFEPDKKHEKLTPEIESFFAAKPMSYTERLF